MLKNLRFYVVFVKLKLKFSVQKTEIVIQI